MKMLYLIQIKYIFFKGVNYNIGNALEVTMTVAKDLETLQTESEFEDIECPPSD